MAIVNMTEGGITEHLVGYSTPLILDNMFQPTYNAANSIIAGRFTGKEALAAKGMVSPVMNVVIFGISDICMGASVLIGEFYGASQKEKLKREMSTTVTFGCYFLALIVILGGFFSEPPPGVLGVPDEILGRAASYLSIIFLGALFTYFCNTVSVAFRSVGGSETPFKFSAFSSTLNVVLGLIFAGRVRLGIVCSAITTVVAETASALPCITHVYKKIPMLQLRRGELDMDKQLPRQILRYDSITALRQFRQSTGKLLIQDAANPLDMSTIAAFNAVNRIDDFVFMPERSISHGIIAFVA